MSDPRGTSRGSKTAAVVMLVVFLQVLVVAVLGLGAIARDRDEARRTAETSAQQGARSELTSLLASAQGEVRDALEDVRTRPDFEDLERLRRDGAHGRHADLVNTVYQVDPEKRVIYWMDGEHRLWLPPEERAAEIEKEQSEAEYAESMERAYEQALSDAADPWQRIRMGLPFFRRFPYRQEPESGYVKALGGILALVKLASEEAAVSPKDDAVWAYRTLEATLLAAIEIAALNRDRGDSEIPLGDRPKLDEVPREVEAVLLGLPPAQAHVRRHVEAYRAARGELDARQDPLRPVLEVALRQVGVDTDVAFVGRRLIGLIPSVERASARRHLLVLMNLEAALFLVQQSAGGPAHAEDLRRLGLDLVLTPVEAPASDDVVLSEDLRQVPLLRLPYRAELHRATEPVLPLGGPGELFYWGIIGLSAAGLGMGGWVLTRLWTREVRLARLKADFVSNLSHELKTPLTSIGMFTEMLQDGLLESEEDRKEGLAVLRQESDRLQGIVHRMLDTAKGEARGVPYDLVPGDLNEVVGRAAERFRRIVTEPGLDLVLKLHPEPLPVLMDRAAVDDVVSNLVSNAWKYKRGDSAHVEVRTARRGRKAEIVVSDDGLGIPRRERRKVFEMFYRADAYLTRAAGTGLGLSLVRTIVRSHGGMVRIENGETGVGTLFRIRIPLRRGAGAETAPASGAITNLSANSEAQATS